MSAWTATLLLASSLLLAACVPATVEAPGSVANSVAVVLGQGGTTLIPYTSVLSSRQVGGLLFRGLFDVADDGSPIGDLCEDVPTKANGGMSADGRTVTYRLDPEARWNDGEPLTAEDVVFTWGLLQRGLIEDDPGQPLDAIESLTAVDPQTVRVGLRRPASPVVWRILPWVLPKHLLEDSADVRSDAFWFDPVGSAGWRVERYDKGSRLDVVRDSGSAPARIVVVFAADATQARKAWDGSARCVWVDAPVGPVGSEKADTVPSHVWREMVMNVSPGHPTSRLSVREAFASLATVTVGQGDMGPYGAPFATRPSQDPGAALARDGWKPAKDGFRYRAGKRLRIVAVSNPKTGEDGYYFQKMPYGRLGMTGKYSPAFEYEGFFGVGTLARREFDVAMVVQPIGLPYGWCWPYRSDDLASLDSPDGLNLSGVRDAQLDAAAAGMAAAGSPEELQRAAASAWTRLEELRIVLFDEQLPTTSLYKGVSGVKARAVETEVFADVDQWRVSGADVPGGN